VNGDYAYIADYERYLYIYDVSDKSAPVLESSFPLSVFSNVHDMWYADGYVYTGHRYGGICMINVSDRKAPFEVACKKYQYIHKGLVSWDHYLFTGENGLTVYDISTNLTSRKSVGGTAGTSQAYEVVVTPDGNYAYGCTSHHLSGFPVRIYNVTNKANPSVVNSFDFDRGEICYEMLISADGKYLYITVFDSTRTTSPGFHIYDLTNPMVPELTATVSHPRALDLSLDDQNNVLYVRNLWSPDAGISAYNVSDPSSPSLLDFYNLSCCYNNYEQNGDVWYSDRYVYAVAEDDLVILEFNTPPVADAGGPYLVAVGREIPLDGSGSVDEDGDTLTYSWSVSGGSVDTTTDDVNPVYTSGAVAGSYDVCLTVNDGKVDSAEDCSTVVVNTPPVL
jgi:hypothetical protein